MLVCFVGSMQHQSSAILGVTQRVSALFSDHDGVKDKHCAGQSTILNEHVELNQSLLHVDSVTIGS
jgi:hypothetical protein